MARTYPRPRPAMTDRTTLIPCSGETHLDGLPDSWTTALLTRSDAVRLPAGFRGAGARRC